MFSGGTAGGREGRDGEARARQGRGGQWAAQILPEVSCEATSSCPAIEHTGDGLTRLTLVHTGLAFHI